MSSPRGLWRLCLLISMLISLVYAREELSILKLASRAIPRGVEGRQPERVKRALNASESLLDYFNGTDLQWYGNISFGTPPQVFTVVFDTGSFTAEIPAVGCDGCQNQHVFNKSASTTFVDLHQTAVLNFSTGECWCGPMYVNNCMQRARIISEFGPADFENMTLSVVNDTLSILNFSAPDTTFNLITSQTSGFAADPFDGTVGMGYFPNSSVFRALNVNNQPSVFALYLTPKNIGNAELTLGGIDESRVTGDIRYAPILTPDRFPFFWSLDSSSISVNGKTTPILGDLTQIIFDSGTSNCVFAKNITEAIYSLISPNIIPHGSLGAYGLPCSQINSTAADITFTFTDTAGKPFNLTVPASEFNVGPFSDDPTTCQTVINALDGLNILGASLMKHYYTVYDVDHAQLGFSMPTAAVKTGGALTMNFVPWLGIFLASLVSFAII